MDEELLIIMDKDTRKKFALWLRGRERVREIDTMLWLDWLAAIRAGIMKSEIQILADVCGPSIFDVIDCDDLGVGL